jgi:hypothetical protein
MERESGISTEAAPPISAVLADVDGTLVTKDKILTERARRRSWRMKTTSPRDMTGSCWPTPSEGAIRGPRRFRS